MNIVFNLNHYKVIMVNFKVVGSIIAGIIVVIAIISLSSQNNTTDSHTSEQSNQVEVSDSASLTTNNPDYTIGEDGKKKYVISAGDSPNLQD